MPAIGWEDWPSRTPSAGRNAVNLRSLVASHHKSFNDHDLDALSEAFDEHVEIVVDGSALHGVAAAVGYTAAIFREFPRLRIHDTRIVAESGDTIVAEHQILNGDPSGGPLRPQGSVCEIYRAREGRIVAYTSYYMPEGADREDVVNVPSRAEGSKMAEEQAALRRVATLVARGVSQDELFAAVNEEVAWLVGADPTSLMRFEADDTLTLVAAWSAADAEFPIGARRPVDDELRALRDDGRALRFGPMELPSDGAFVEEARTLAIRSAVGVPIVVDGRVWGAAFAASTREEPFPDDTTARIAGFTELVATAISNTESRVGLARLAQEQAALRRVATLAARGTSPEELFAAVVEEVVRVLPVKVVAMARYESAGTMMVVASSDGVRDRFPVGSRWPLGGKNVSTAVFETGRPARIDGYAGAAGRLGAAIREQGVHSSVGAPIVVEGRLWGVMTASSGPEQPLPVDTEARLVSFTELVATAIANAEARTELAASRARIVAATDDERRRVVRDLHDGAQARLVHTVVTIKLAQQAVQNVEEGVPALLTEALDNAEQATDELRELAHGILPEVLTRGGLRESVDALASRMPVPVEIDVSVGRLPAAVEATAYFVVAEALTNVAKHAHARRAEVTARIEHGCVQVRIHDDGVGGALPDGTGLTGLADRLAVLDGQLRVDSPPHGGTLVAADIPVPG
jgi:signal transduction histidine kinase/ketosteroid isomerase-like protein